MEPHEVINEFLLAKEPEYRKLSEIRRKGWEDPRGDEHFKKQRHRADNARNEDAVKFYKMMQQIGDELEETTNALSQRAKQNVKVLDLCMAPGGYTASALKYNPGGQAFGITLPASLGGHQVLLPSSQSTIRFLDITLLAKEFGVDRCPEHPDTFNNDRPFVEHEFDLVFCDGQVLRTHTRGQHRLHHEARRLTVSQLILALQRIKTGGTLIMLLHKVEAWDSTELLYQFSHFSQIQLFKPKKKHAIRSSFYLVARNVQPEKAKEALEMWKLSWWQATFGGEGMGAAAVMPDEGYVRNVLDQFGTQLIELSRPVWTIQADALSKSSFLN